MVCVATMASTVSANISLLALDACEQALPLALWVSSSCLGGWKMFLLCCTHAPIVLRGNYAPHFFRGRVPSTGYWPALVRTGLYWPSTGSTGQIVSALAMYWHTLGRPLTGPNWSSSIASAVTPMIGAGIPFRL